MQVVLLIIDDQAQRDALAGVAGRRGFERGADADEIGEEVVAVGKGAEQVAGGGERLLEQIPALR